uniref:Rab11 interacting protein, isoform D n=1 Tax=Drosophila melanogaster TaxID=7227 RepID=X2JL40_DROME|nr:Rab11 interacting protein, isoform D [Drosophila melanogaster]AHN59882.1 Rab11 interacting protein, isoform D [Drosophila melanogaster]|eukprot:NP_001285412.1 Rab11 interacting protein, isoform D [Drosophila melanogaster]
MWSPTHCSVTVQRARGLLTKGKNGTNNCFVTIALGKEKYQTSVKDKAETSVNWNEECELKIPDQGNRAELTLTCLHRNNLGIDEFLGQATLPLNEMDVYDRPRAKWFKLESKPGKEKKNKERGELEVRIAFVVKSGSLTDLSKKDKHKSSIGQLASSVGGSLLSIGNGEKRRGIKKLAGSLSSKLHIRSKKKNQEAGADDSSSFGGSFASLGTPNSSNGRGQNGGSGRRRGGQRAGEADPGVISEDEDEFVFDNLSHKSSGSSLNIQRIGLQPPPVGTPNFTPRHPSPLLNNGVSGVGSGSAKGKQAVLPATLDEDASIDAEMEQLELDFSVRAHARANANASASGNASTLPPPSKPPRIPLSQVDEQPAAGSLEREKPKEKPAEVESDKDEWASKLYGGGKYLEIGSSNSLKRRSWEDRVPLPASVEEPPPLHSSSSSSSSSSDSDDDDEKPPQAAPPPVPVPASLPVPSAAASTASADPVVATSSSLFSPDVEHRNFDTFNASFAKYEQRNSTAIFADEPELEDLTVELEKPAPTPTARPKPQPRATADLRAEEEKAKEEAARQLRAEEDARLEAELRLNEERLREEEEAMQRELEEEKERQKQLQMDEQQRREAKRWEEDQRLLSFAKRSTSLEEPVPEKQELKHERELVAKQEPEKTLDTAEPEPEHNFLTPEQSPKEFQTNGSGSGSGERWEKRLGKFKYGNKRDKYNNDNDSNSPSPKSTERIIIGHEKSGSHADRRSEISAQLAKKYEGKSREELMLIANGMENEALLQRQRVKELEDYLDNLLLRVMETHPKILQNPYSRTTSAKSYKNYINMNDFLK